MSKTDSHVVKELVNNYSMTELQNELHARQREKARKGKAGKRQGLISTQRNST